MNDKKMSDVEKFNKWHSGRMGHPLGVQLGKNAVVELTEELQAKTDMMALVVEECNKLRDCLNVLSDADNHSVSQVRSAMRKARQLLNK